MTQGEKRLACCRCSRPTTQASFCTAASWCCRGLSARPEVTRSSSASEQRYNTSSTPSMLILTTTDGCWRLPRRPTTRLSRWPRSNLTANGTASLLRQLITPFLPLPLPFFRSVFCSCLSPISLSLSLFLTMSVSTYAVSLSRGLYAFSICLCARLSLFQASVFVAAVLF